MAKVCVRLMGGLGNQLFQYAAGRALATRLGAELWMDVSWFREDLTRVVSREYNLRQVFQLQVLTYTLTSWVWERRIRSLLPASENLGLCAKIRRKFFGTLLRIIRYYTLYRLFGSDYTHFLERYFHYTPDWTKLSGNVYLIGYWQSERYFANIIPELRQELSLSHLVGERTAALLSEINQPHSVSVHLRRGDYHKKNWLLPLSYYVRALKLLRALIRTQLRLYVFCDNAQELKTLLPDILKDTHLPYEIVSGQGYSAQEEMLLMSRCQHHIMSNSTYSWWAVWLHDKAVDERLGEKHVIAPRAWIPPTPPREGYKDLFCDGWILL